MRQTHAVTVKKLLKREVIFQSIGTILAKLLGQFGDELAVRFLQDRQGLASALSNLAGVLTEEGNFTDGMNLLTEALATRRKIGDKSGIALSLLNMAEIASNQAAE